MLKNIARNMVTTTATTTARTSSATVIRGVADATEEALQTGLQIRGSSRVPISEDLGRMLQEQEAVYEEIVTRGFAEATIKEKEAVGELAGRIEMLRDGFVPVEGGTGIWKYSGNNGIDQVFHRFDDASNLRVLESKFKGDFRITPRTRLSFTEKLWQAMGEGIKIRNGEKADR